jgi:hypothetical protein
VAVVVVVQLVGVLLELEVPDTRGERVLCPCVMNDNRCVHLVRGVLVVLVLVLVLALALERGVEPGGVAVGESGRHDESVRGVKR